MCYVCDCYYISPSNSIVKLVLNDSNTMLSTNINKKETTYNRHLKLHLAIITFQDNVRNIVACRNTVRQQPRNRQLYNTNGSVNKHASTAKSALQQRNSVSTRYVPKYYKQRQLAAGVSQSVTGLLRINRYELLLSEVGN
jgi:hypothetical protein